MCGEESVNAALFSQSKRSKNLIFGHRRNSIFRSYARIYFARRRHPGAQRFAKRAKKSEAFLKGSEAESQARRAQRFAKRYRKPVGPRL
jgi:hypothetical protein